MFVLHGYIYSAAAEVLIYLEAKKHPTAQKQLPADHIL